MRILVIEDQKKLANSLTRGFQQEGYASDCLCDGLEAERRLAVSHKEYDILILDIGLPGKNGLDLCRDLRKKGVMTPILMLTAKDTVEDKIQGLDVGADDYVVKPFSFEEVLSRVRALSRRLRTTLPPELTVGTLHLKPATQEVFQQGKSVELTLKEFRILEFFMLHANEVLNRQQIADHLWDFEFNSLSRVMDVHINNLRNKLKYSYASPIETIRGIGYRLKA